MTCVGDTVPHATRSSSWACLKLKKPCFVQAAGPGSGGGGYRFDAGPARQLQGSSLWARCCTTLPCCLSTWLSAVITHELEPKHVPSLIVAPCCSKNQCRCPCLPPHITTQACRTATPLLASSVRLLQGHLGMVTACHGVIVASSHAQALANKHTTQRASLKLLVLLCALVQGKGRL